MRLREALAEDLSDEELSILPSGFDIIGDIAILEIPDELRDKERLIGERVLSLIKHVDTVVAKDAPHEGELRTRKIRHLAGEEKTRTIHKESATRIEVDVEGVYFSPRLSHERLRIAQEVQEGEIVLVMFSGCGPFALVIAKNSQVGSVVAVELNEVGHELCLSNIMKNKVSSRVRCLQGDVREVVPTLEEKFDRVLMPLPEGGEHFLDVALGAVKTGGIVHFYDFLHESEIPQVALAKVEGECKVAHLKHEVLGHTLCGQIGVRKYRVCVDFRVLS